MKYPQLIALLAGGLLLACGNEPDPRNRPALELDPATIAALSAQGRTPVRVEVLEWGRGIAS